MTEPVNQQPNISKVAMIIKLYPVGLLIIAAFINWLMGIQPIRIALPEHTAMLVLLSAVVMLVFNHTWLMTTTELTRLRFGLQTTPEEWKAKGLDHKSASELGIQELQRHHNAHRNMTENTLLFSLLAPLFLFTSPVLMAIYVWLVGFALGRLGHTLAYLSGNDGLRGIFMSISLLGLYGMVSYLMLALLV